MSDLLAINSLESVDHATKKDPNTISVVWMLGRRCNYNCSYCSPFLHDNYSSHLPLEKIKSFLDDLDKQVSKTNKKLKLNITGGEPFVHPQILKILEHIKNIKNCSQLVVTTNGSLPYSLYEKSSKYITNLTISLHFEQGEKVLNSTVEKIIKLNKIDTWFLNVNVMALPGKFKELENTIDLFNKNNVKYIIRKIDPPLENFDKQAIVEDNFLIEKKKHKDLINESLEDNWKDYYSEFELEYLKNNTSQVSWNNMRLHYSEEQSVETNSDNLKSIGKNSFKDWYCFIGIDTLNIQHDGTVYRGYCMVGESIGSIQEGINWPTEPIVCNLKYCECSADIITRKAKNKKSLKLIE